jgi:hypothetical protein
MARQQCNLTRDNPELGTSRRFDAFRRSRMQPRDDLLIAAAKIQVQDAAGAVVEDEDLACAALADCGLHLKRDLGLRAGGEEGAVNEGGACAVLLIHMFRLSC